MNLDRASLIAVENVSKEGLTDIFPRPHEVDLLKSKKFSDELQRQVEARIKSNSLQGLKIHSVQHVLFPKKDPFDFRRAALMQPLDTITFLALTLSIAEEIERHRPKVGKNCVFSYRFKPKDGLLFNPKYTYTSFEKYVNDRSKAPRTKILVKCDIASFYDRLNLHRLESTLLGMSIDRNRVKVINELLLFWANRDSYGLPIGGNGSRILAEAALISIDDYLLSHDIKFCRFVDDYRFFAPDVKSAHVWLTLFVERLFLEGLTINPSKTSLEDVSARKNIPIALSPDSFTFPSGKKEIGPARLIVGYSGIIPTKFRELSERESIELEKENLTNAIEFLKTNLIIKPDDIRRLLRIIVAKNAFIELTIVPEILDRFPQFTPLVVDILVKKSNGIPADVQKLLKDYFIEKLSLADKSPEYILIAIVRLLGSNGYRAKIHLLELFRNLKRNAGSFIGRCIIDTLSDMATRNDVLEIRQYFNRADLWERRAIIRLVNKHLAEEEKRPWLKNVKVHSSDDLFAIESFDPKK